MHFTSPSTMILLCIVLGATITVPLASVEKGFQRVIALIGLAGVALVLITAIAADHRMRDGVAALAQGEREQADEHFQLAATLRFWDADVPLMVVESYAEAIEFAVDSAILPLTTPQSRSPSTM